MELWTAFMLGLVGSLHCAGMCGPLALALPVAGKTRGDFVLGRLLYNLGRILTYTLLGAVFGLLGQSFALAGFQKWVSLVAGVAILLGLVASLRVGLGLPITKSVVWLKSSVGRLLQQRTFGSLFLLGSLNGLLPCGLVYVAATAAAATGSLQSGVLSMALFGLGTLPVMLGMGLAGRKLQGMLNLKLQRLVPISLAVLGVLLILRGMELGIPYVSPVLTAGGCPHCH
ncbi:MAG TPA: sulfite exporter TauE/SafE family protein [Verrucomicrobiae bacterium]